MRILGLDPGLTRAGWGVVEHGRGGSKLLDCGIVTTSASDPTPKRLSDLAGALRGLIRELDVDAAAVERVFFTRNAQTAIGVAQAAGVMQLAAHDAGLTVTEYTPNEVKLAVTGDGKADKQQVQHMVMTLLGLARPPSPADAADAVAIALTHASASRLKGLNVG